MAPSASVLRLVACGSVDDGKSTLIGRLLAQTGSVPDDQLQMARTTRRSGSTIALGEIDFSLLTDGLEGEREQGITIDVAYRHCYLPSGRRMIVADAPGHEQYTRNMAVAASTADAALLLVDAVRGVRPQTIRHLTICALMGVRHLVVAVNKLDAVNFDQSVFDALAAQVRDVAGRFDIADVQVIAVSALSGDNVMAASPNMSWFDGPTLIDALDAVQSVVENDQSLRLPVQLVVRADGFRGLAGTIARGSVAIGDMVAVAGRDTQARVSSIVDTDRATAGEAVCLTLEPEVDVARGDLLTSTHDTAIPADRFSTDVVWLGDSPLAHGRSYLLISGPLSVPATVMTLRHRLDIETGNEQAARILELNEIGRVELATAEPVPLESYQHSRDTGSFLLVDRVTGETAAAGMVRHALRRSANVVHQDYVVDRQARSRLNQHHARVVWLTGLSGSGKSTIANAVEQQLHARGLRTYVLDGDNVRSGLTKDLGFTPEDRAENVRRVAETARLMVDAGLVVLVALVSPYRPDRQAARDLFDAGDFIEVYVDTPIEVCAQRDSKGLYAKAADGSLPNLTGVGQSYEAPEQADVVLSGTDDLATSVQTLVELIDPLN